MKLYQFTLDVEEGTYSHTVERFVLAQDDRLAAQYARQFADAYRPNARFDSEHDIYSDPSGWPQWRFGSCAPINRLTISIAGTDMSLPVVLVPSHESYFRGLTIADRLVQTMLSMSPRSRLFRWLLNWLFKDISEDLAAYVSWNHVEEEWDEPPPSGLTWIARCESVTEVSI